MIYGKQSKSVGFGREMENQKLYFCYKKMNEDIEAKDMLRWFVGDVIGTMIISPDKVKTLIGSHSVGRTFFNDRLKQRCPFNQHTVIKLHYVYAAIFNRDSEYDPVIVSQTLSSLIAEKLEIRTDFLVFFDDDTDELVKAKARNWCLLIDCMANPMCNRERLPAKEIQHTANETLKRIFHLLENLAYDKALYTAILLADVRKNPKTLKETEDDDRGKRNSEVEGNTENIEADIIDTETARNSEANQSEDADCSHTYTQQSSDGTDRPTCLIQQVMTNTGSGKIIGVNYGTIGGSADD